MNEIRPVPFIAQPPAQTLRGGYSLKSHSTGYARDSIARLRTDAQVDAFHTRINERSTPMIRHTMTVAEAKKFYLRLNDDPLKPFQDGSAALADKDKVTVWFEKNATTPAQKTKKFDQWKDAKAVAIYRSTHQRDTKPLSRWSNERDLDVWNGKPDHLKVSRVRLIAKRVPHNLKTNWKMSWGGIINPTSSGASATAWLGSTLGGNGLIWGLCYLVRILADQPQPLPKN